MACALRKGEPEVVGMVVGLYSIDESPRYSVYHKINHIKERLRGVVDL